MRKREKEELHESEERRERGNNSENRGHEFVGFKLADNGRYYSSLLNILLKAKPAITQT